MACRAAVPCQTLNLRTSAVAIVPGDNRRMSLTDALSHRLLPADRHALAEAFRAHAQSCPAQVEVAASFIALLEDVADPFLRERLDGHFTASAWLLDRSRARVLLTHHRKLGIWVQLGGHADGDRDLARVALREAEEESGLVDLRVEPSIFDLDRHWIPERKDVPGHWHYDVRYVVLAEGREDFVVSAESHALAWREIASIADDADADTSLRRMAQAWLARSGAVAA